MTEHRQTHIETTCIEIMSDIQNSNFTTVLLKIISHDQNVFAAAMLLTGL